MISGRNKGDLDLAGYAWALIAWCLFYGASGAVGLFVVGPLACAALLAAIVIGIKTRSRINGAIILAVCVGVIVWHMGRHYDWWQNRGEAEAKSHICGMLLRTDSSKAEGVTDARVYVQAGGPSDATFYFRFHATPQVLKQIVERCHLEVRTLDRILNKERFQNAPPWWWKPNFSGSILYESPLGTLRNITVLYDPQSQVVYCRNGH